MEWKELCDFAAGDALYASTVPWEPTAIALRALGLEFPRAADDDLVRLGLPRTLALSPP